VSSLKIAGLRFRNIGPIHIDVGPSECVSLTGPSGSGKTLMLRALADLDPHEGDVFLDDVECAGIPAPAWRRQVAMLPSEGLWWFDTVGEHFSVIDEGRLAMLGFEKDVTAWQVSRLSTGERQRLALARLLCNEPKALLLDEPTASLDSANRSLVERLISVYMKESGAPVIWVSHDPEQAGRVASRHFIINKGILVEEVQK